MYYYLNRIEIRDKNGNFITSFSVAGLPKNVPVKDNSKKTNSMIEDITKRTKSKRIIPTGIIKHMSFIPEKWLFLSLAIDNYGHIFVQGGDYSDKVEVYVLNYLRRPADNF